MATRAAETRDMINRTAKRNYMYDTPAWDNYINSVDSFQNKITPNIEPGPSSPLPAPVPGRSEPLAAAMQNFDLWQDYQRSLGPEKKVRAVNPVQLDPSQVAYPQLQPGSMINLLPPGQVPPSPAAPFVFAPKINETTGEWERNPVINWADGERGFVNIGERQYCADHVIEPELSEVIRLGEDSGFQALPFKNAEGKPICTDCFTRIKNFDDQMKPIMNGEKQKVYPKGHPRAGETMFEYKQHCDNCRMIGPLTNTDLTGKEKLCRSCFADTQGFIPERLDLGDRIAVATSKLMDKLTLGKMR